MSADDDLGAADADDERPAAVAGQASAFAQMVVGGMAGTMLLLSGGLAFLEVADRLNGEGQAQAVAVLSATETLVTAPPVTVTTQDPAAAWAALMAAASTTTSSTTTTTAPAQTTTTTAPPPTTTTTARPAPIGKASATTTVDGVTLEVDVAPALSGEVRSLDAGLLVNFDDARVLRAVQVDFGDGTVFGADVQPLACTAPDAGNPQDLALPGHTYAGPGSYVVKVTAITASCGAAGDEGGTQSLSEVELTIPVP